MDTKCLKIDVYFATTKFLKNIEVSFSLDINYIGVIAVDLLKMSIQWTVIAGYLYFEIGVVIILMLPIASPRRWQQFFRSRLFSLIREQAVIYFYVLLGVLVLFLIDAIREMRKYSHTSDGGHIHIAAEMKGSVKLFRAQRNFYITGFAIFLAFVIRRLVTMILIQAELLERSADIIREAEAAKELAKTTVLAHTLQSGDDTKEYYEIKSQLELHKELLEDIEKKNGELEREVTLWKSKYEEIAKEVGKGDQ